MVVYEYEKLVSRPVLRGSGIDFGSWRFRAVDESLSEAGECVASRLSRRL